jgi:hypothetical protein
MIRTLLASPWFSLSTWIAILFGVLLVAQHKSLKRRDRNHDLKPLVGSLVSPPGPHSPASSIPPERPPAQVIPVTCKPVSYWYPKRTVFRLTGAPFSRLGEEITTNQTQKTTEANPSIWPPITTLSIRAGIDPSRPTVVNKLGIQCRTYAPISNAHRNISTMHGVVTQDVVSSAGKILIMAGSRVVGRATADPENGRLKSDGLWSVFCDSTEIKVQARLVDGFAGMAGILGQETSNEDATLQREAVVRDGRYVFVPEKTSFTLEVYGDISLRDLKSNETND